MKKFYIINSNYYDEISKRLLKGAENFCNKNKIEYRVIDVAGALEIPSAINIINENIATKVDGVTIHSDNVGFIALGCVIKGKTSHYHHLCTSVVNSISDLSVKSKKPIGNGILTCDNIKQALIRANPNKKNKGGEAAEAVLSVLNIIKYESK